VGLLELRELTKVYKRRDKPFNVVNYVSLSVDPEDFISITGRSGSGKSTLLNMSAGLLRPTSRSILIERRDIHRLNDKDISLPAE
jgi:putative ABC transport system ATP-binding protein